MTQRTAGNASVLKFEGRVDEHADFSAVVWHGVAEAIFDLEGVSLFSSIGVKRWIGFLSTIPADVRLKFLRCSIAVVHQLNQMVHFTASRVVTVDSVQLPYYCDHCDQTATSILLLSGLALNEEPTVIKHQPCKTCGGQMELETDTAWYLMFRRRLARQGGQA